MNLQTPLRLKSFIAKVALKSFGLVGVILCPLFLASHRSFLGGTPLDVILQAHWVSEKSLAGGAVEKSPVLVFG